MKSQDTYKVLLVDDSLFILEALRQVLISNHGGVSGIPDMNYSVITATSGQQALEKVAAERPDLILMGVIMPGMSGFDVLARLKESNDTRHIPVIIISGLTEDEDEEKGFLLGAVDYVKKPFKKAVVLARIKTHLKTIEQMRIIEQHSLMDSLTNMPNRRSLDNRMEAELGRAIRGKIPTSILMIDIDHFKKFNDTYGHRQGDLVLQAVAHTITSSLKRSSDFAARWGGEEFMTLLPNTDLKGAVVVAEHIRLAIAGGAVMSLSGSLPLKVEASIGAASFVPVLGDTFSELIEKADKALYIAKESGRNRVCAYTDKREH